MFLKIIFLPVSSPMRHSKCNTLGTHSPKLLVMGDHHWPKTGQHRPKAVAEHLASLKADFDSVYNTVEASLSRATELPSKLRDKISKGITDGIAKAQSDSHWFKCSKADKDSFTRTILDNITNESAASAQDTIPLAQFYGLCDSYQELHAKLEGQLPATAAHRHLDDVGEEATSNVAVVNGIQITEKKSYSATIILNVVHQASVNRMEGETSRWLGEAILVLLEAFFSDYWFRGSVRLSAASLLDCGDVEVFAHAEHRGDLERLIQTTTWHEEFERSLGPSPAQTYNVRMHNMRIGCIIFKNRKEKSVVIKTLANNNFTVTLTTASSETFLGAVQGRKKQGPLRLW